MAKQKAESALNTRLGLVLFWHQLYNRLYNKALHNNIMPHPNAQILGNSQERVIVMSQMVWCILMRKVIQSLHDNTITLMEQFFRDEL